MRGMRLVLLLLLLFAVLAMPVSATELYRCTVEGRTVHQNAPCKEGRVIDTDEREAIRGYDSHANENASTRAIRTAPRASVQPSVPQIVRRDSGLAARGF